MRNPPPFEIFDLKPRGGFLTFSVFGQILAKISDIDPQNFRACGGLRNGKTHCSALKYPIFSRLRRAQKRKNSLFCFAIPQIFRACGALKNGKTHCPTLKYLFFFAPAALRNGKTHCSALKYLIFRACGGAQKRKK